VGDIDWAYNEFKVIVGDQEFNAEHENIKIAPVAVYGSRAGDSSNLA